MATIAGGADVQFNDCVFGLPDRGANIASSSGGAMTVVESVVTLSNSRSNAFGNITAQNGGFAAIGNGANFKIQGGDYRSHAVSGSGGAFALTSLGGSASLASNFSIVNATLTDNRAYGDYGGSFWFDWGFSDITSATTNVTFRDVTCTNCYASAFGGCFMFGPNGARNNSIVVSDSRFRDNFAESSGGDIYAAGYLDLFRSNFTGSRSSGTGGSLLIGPSGSARVFGPLVFSNSASRSGGAVFVNGKADFYGELTINNSTASATGGGIDAGYNGSPINFWGPVRVNNCSAASGGNLCFYTGYVFFNSSVIIRNGTASSSGGNLVTYSSSVTFAGPAEFYGGSAGTFGGNIAVLTDTEGDNANVTFTSRATIDGGRAPVGANLAVVGHQTYARTSLAFNGSPANPILISNAGANASSVYLLYPPRVEFHGVTFENSTSSHIEIASGSSDTVVVVTNSFFHRARQQAAVIANAGYLQLDSTSDSQFAPFLHFSFSCQAFCSATTKAVE